MPDEWGGVEIEDEFGGVLVEDESPSQPPERESATFVEPPPMPEMPTHDEAGFPIGLDPRQRRQLETVSEMAAARSEGEPLQRAARFFARNLPGDLLAPTTEEFLSGGEKFRASIPPEMRLPQTSPLRPPTTAAELSPETRESLAAGQAASGMLADLSSADQALLLGAAAASGGVPGTAGRILGAAVPATFGALGVKSIYEGGKTLLSDDATPEERGQAKFQIGMGATLLPGFGGLVKRPAIPPRAVEAIAKADAVGLTKSAQALADTVKKSQESAARVIEVEAKVEPAPVGERPRGTPPEVTPPREAPPAPANTLTADVARERAIAAEKKALLDSEDIMTLGENPKWMELSKEFEDIKNRYQGRKPSDVAAESKPMSISSASNEVAKMDKPAQTLEKGGNKITPETEPERIVVQAEQDLGGGETMPGYVTIQSKGNAQSGPVEAWRAAGHEIPDTAGLPSGTYTVAELRARANEKAIPATTEAATPAAANQTPIPARQAPVVEPGVGAVRENVPASAFFERESEAAGLGRSSLPPTVADVRAQRARDVVQTDTIETQAVDPASGAPVAAKVSDTAGTNVKMRKSAERATVAPEIPKPVQERIEAAPESRYTQQSMARVEDAVKAMPDAELAAIPADSNLYVASKLEQADRRFRAGDNDAGYAIFVELEKQGTSFGQNINQFKRLAATKPEFVATVIDKKLTKAGKDPLTPAQRTQAIETTRKAKAADLALDKSTDAWTKNPTAENAAKAEAALDKANAEAVELQKFVAKFEPRSTSGVLKSVLQGNLLTPISEVANLFGNMSFLPFRALDRAVGTGLDIIDSAVRGKPRELSVQPLAGTAEALKGVGRGLKEIPSILIEGTGNVIKGETRAGLHPIKAWINQFAKNPEMPTTGGKLTLKDRLNLAIEGTFGVPAEVMLRGLGAGDVPFKEGARARVTAEQLQLNNVPRGNWAFAQKFPELFLPKEALQQIQKDTMAAVFQRESKTLNLMTNWLKGKGEVLDFVAATVAPYKLTPWNIVGEILSYNPLIAMARGANDARLGNTRAAKLNAGKMVVGSMLTGTGIWLYKNGLLAPSLDERDEAQKARVLSGKVLPPNHINISGLKRATSGGDPAFKAGDETVDVFRAGGLAGAMFYMTANIGRDMERGPTATDGDMWMNIIRQSTLEQARFGLNQSFLSGVDGLLTAIKEGNADNYLRQWANTVGSIPLPNTLNTVSRAMRKYQVDTKADDFKDKIGNMVKTKLGFAELDDYLPLKRDFWGKPMLETPEGRDAIFYHFFDISKNKQVTSDPVELELYRLWRKTGDTAVIPSLPQRDVTFARTGYALNPKQYERYAELVGENRRNIVDALAVNPQFHKLDDEQKIKLLERVYRDGMERGKALFYREFNGQLEPKQGRAGFPP